MRMRRAGTLAVRKTQYTFATDSGPALARAVEPGPWAAAAFAALLRGDFPAAYPRRPLAMRLASPQNVENAQPFVEPCPGARAAFSRHAMLNVDLLRLVARGRERRRVELLEHAAALPIDDLVFVEKIRGAFSARRRTASWPPWAAARLALLEESAERGRRRYRGPIMMAGRSSSAGGAKPWLFCTNTGTTSPGFGEIGEIAREPMPVRLAGSLAVPGALADTVRWTSRGMGFR